MRPLIARTLAPLLAVLMVASIAAAKTDSGVTLSFSDADLPEVVKVISEITGKNFIVSDEVKGKVTLISPSKLTTEEAFEVFQSILDVKGYTIVPAGKVFKIVPAKQAKQTTIETLRGPGGAGDRFVTRLFPLDHIDAAEASNVLEPLKSAHGAITAYPPTNTLIITDSSSNIDRLIEIIAELDVETVDRVIEIVEVSFASAPVVATLISQAMEELGDQAGAGVSTTAEAGGAKRNPRQQRVASNRAKQPGAKVSSSVKILADERINVLIVIGEPSMVAEVKKLLAALDVEVPAGTGKIHVHYLRYADAESVASVLTNITDSAASQTQQRPGQPSQIPAQRARAATAASTATHVPVQFREPVHIMPDKATNSLVIIASTHDFQTLKGVIEQLDIRRPQVLVEAVILEMTYDKLLDLGVEWRSVNDPSSDQVNIVGGTNFGGISSLMTSPLGLPTGAFLGAIDGTITWNGQEFLNIGALLRALQQNQDVNVLSTPHILTTDNEEAEILVSDNIPFQTSQKFDSNGNPIFTFEYRDVGLTLRLTPQINEEDFVKLKLFQEISEIIDTTTGTTENAPTTTKRSAKTTVVLKNGSSVVIGGLLKDNQFRNVSAVPCLGEIPLVGALFRTTRDEREKTNLLIFLTPHIVKTPEDLARTTKRKTDQYKSEMERKTDKDKEVPHDERVKSFIEEGHFEGLSKPEPKPEGENK